MAATHRSRLAARGLESGRFGAVELSWSKRDDARFLTAASIVIVVAAPTFAAFGLPHVPLMWPLHRVGLVFPGCGLTRGVVAIAKGDVSSAWTFNPASLLAAFLVPIGVLRAVAGLTTARWLSVRIRPGPWMVVVGVLAVAALWVRQQANADLLMTR